MINVTVELVLKTNLTINFLLFENIKDLNFLIITSLESLHYSYTSSEFVTNS